MKTKTKLLIIALISILAVIILGITTIVRAEETVTCVSTYEELATAVTAGGNIKLEGDITGNVTIPSGKTVILDLNGHDMTASSGVIIKNNGTLTIKGEGNVIANGNYAVLNNGPLLTIKGGTYSKTTPSATQSLISNGWYNAANNTSGEYSIMIIDGGSFDGGSYTAIKNDSYGKMTINGGTFTSTHASVGIQEAGTMLTINGGIFDAVVGLTPACTILGEEKTVAINAGTFNKAVQTYNVSGTTVYASTMKLTISNEATYNNNLNLSQRTKNTTIDMDHNISGLTVKGTLTLGGYILSDTLPDAFNLSNINAGGITLSSIDKEKTSIISNSTITNKIMAGNVILNNVITKEFTNNSKNGTVTIGNGTNITKINATSNAESAIIVDGGTVGQIANTGSTKAMGFDFITINSGSVGPIQTSKGDIVVNGGTVESITIIDKYVTTNPVSVTVKEDATIGIIDNQRANDETATVETTITIPDNCEINDEGKVITNISEARISNINKSFIYTGKAIELNPTVKCNNKTLVKDTDYTITYESNVNVGTAKLIITGIGTYKGTITKTFIILPEAVTGSIGSQSESSIYVTWNSSNGANGYDLYMSANINGTFEKIATTTATYYNIESLSYGKEYYFKVIPYATIDGTNQYGEYSSVFSGITAPKKTTLKSAIPGNKKVTLKWSKSSKATGYVIYMSTSKNGDYKKIKTIKDINTVTYTKNGLMPNKTYYFKVKAIIKEENGIVYSSFSNKKSAKVQLIHLIQNGDNLTKLAKKYKTTVKKIVKLNNIKNKNLIIIGKKLRIF